MNCGFIGRKTRDNVFRGKRQRSSRLRLFSEKFVGFEMRVHAIKFNEFPVFEEFIRCLSFV